MCCAVLLWAGSLTGYAQKAKSQTQFKFSKKMTPGEDYIPGKLIIKLKDQYKGALNDPNSILSTAVRSVSAAAPEQTFSAKSFQKQTFRKGKPSVDLMSIYYLNIPVMADIEKSINEILATGMVEYCEPSYIYKLAYESNDPEAASQYYLDAINAYAAWDVIKGDTNVVIGIVDSGFDFAHPDLTNFAYNWDDPIDGEDNDNDGYIDNFQGWDFIGNDFDDVQPDNIPQLESPGIDHGIQAAGCASADTDNGEGIAGTAFSCKILATKHADTNSRLSIGFGYEGIVYMAEQGADVINCSWGGPSYSSFAQDVINYVVNDLGAIVVAAAGNDNTSDPNYPAAYEGVFSVGASTQFTSRASFSNYGYWVDVMAPGQSIYTTAHSRGDVYSGTSGTSFSSPITAGAAGLIKSMYPDFTPEQVMALLKVTCNPTIYQNEPSFTGQLGNGVIDLGKAVSTQPPAVRISQYAAIDDNNGELNAGEEGYISLTFTNKLWATSDDFTATLSVDNFNVEVLEAVGQVGVLDTDESREYTQTYRIKLKSNTRENERAIFRMDYTQADGFQDFEFFEVLINPSYTVVDKNNIAFSIDSEGTLGHHAQDREEGIGFIYNGEDILYEMGLVLGVSDRKIASSCRTGAASYSEHFRAISLIREIPGVEDDHYYYEGVFDDSRAGSRRPNVEVRHAVRVWPDAPDNQYAILEYHVKNTGNAPLDPLYVGLFADWDIQEYYANRADFSRNQQLGYVYNTQPGGFAAGMQLVSSDKVNAMGINNNQDALESPFGIYDDFTDAEKFLAISSEDQFTKAGFVPNADTGLDGADVSNTVASGPHFLAPGDSLTVAFAVMAADDILALQGIAERAKTKYEPFIITGLEDDVQNEFSNKMKLFPNPTNQSATLLLEGLEGKHTIDVLSPLGQVLNTQNVVLGLGQEQVNINLDNFGAGLYLVRVTNEEGQAAVIRLTKE